MTQSFEKSVKGGTKIKLAAPKSKYVEHILVATHAGEAGVAEVFRTMTHRLRDSTWTIVFKALIIVHLMIREGEPNMTLRFLADQPSKLAISNFSDGNLIDAVLTKHGNSVQVQGANIRHYYGYLLSRAKAFRDTKTDWVRDGQGRLKKQSIEKGLMREVEVIQKQISALLKCDLFNQDAENEITLTAFRLLTMDLLSLYHVMNEGTINCLEHYFEMSRVDAERTLGIYKTFAKLTDEVVTFLSIARQYESATRLEIPKLKHAPTTMADNLEDYLNDPDFEVNRRQFLAAQQAKKGGKFDASDLANKSTPNNSSSNQRSQESRSAQPAASRPVPKGPAPDLIDFFESIEQNQQPMVAQPLQQISNLQAIPQYQFQQQPFQTGQVQQNGFPDTNPFAQMAAQQQQQQNLVQQGFPSFNGQQTGAQPFSPGQLSSIPQDQMASFQQQPFQTGQQQNFMGNQPPQPFKVGQPQPQFNTAQAQPFNNGQQLQAFNTGQQQSTNPFRQSIMSAPTASPAFASPQSATSQSTNPFARNMTGQPQGSPFTSQPPSATTSIFSNQSLQSPQSAQPLQPTRTGTNPFARSAPASTMQTPITSPLTAQATGTNPFRQSAFVNQQTGQGWQANQGTMGGLEQLDSIPVFPRPLGQPPQQMPQQQPWP